MKTHSLKILPEYFKSVRRGDKTAEIRLDDRDYRIGDVLILSEWKPRKKEFTGRNAVRIITDITRLCYVMDGEFDNRWCVLHMMFPPIGSSALTAVRKHRTI